MANKKITVKRIYDAPIATIWEAWTVPAIMQEWFAPENMSTPEAAVDLKIGGKQMLHMKGPKGEDFINNGEYKEIAPMKKLVFSWQWQNDPVISEVSVLFNELSDNQTEVVLTHEFPNEKAVGQHLPGWESTFKKLEKVLK